jgi:hypothetical protein
VPEQLLHGAQVGAPVEQVGGERVAKGVRVRRSRRPTVEDAASVARCQRLAALVREHGVACAGGYDLVSDREPGLDRSGSGFAEWHAPLLRALAPHDQRPIA